MAAGSLSDSPEARRRGEGGRLVVMRVAALVAVACSLLAAAGPASAYVPTCGYAELNRRTDEWQHLDTHARVQSRDAVPDGAAEGPASPRPGDRTMTAHGLLSFVLCAAVSEAPEPGPFSSGMSEVVEVTPIRLAEAADFVREGVEIFRKDAVLVRVRVSNPAAFVPRGISQPVFVYGATACREVQSPMYTGEAVVLCAIPEKSERAVLWLTVSGRSSALRRRENAEAEYRDASKPGSKRVLPLPPPPAGAAKATFRDFSDLRDDLIEKSRKAPGNVPKR